MVDNADKLKPFSPVAIVCAGGRATPFQAILPIFFAFLGLVWSRTDLFGHDDVIFESHMHGLHPGITMSAPTGLGRPQNSDSACLLASGITRHHYLVVRVVCGWLVSPLGACMGDNDVIVICSRDAVRWGSCIVALHGLGIHSQKFNSVRDYL